MRPGHNAHYYRSEYDSDDDDDHEDYRRTRHDDDDDDADEEATRSPGTGSPTARDSLPVSQQWPQSYRWMDSRLPLLFLPWRQCSENDPTSISCASYHTGFKT